MHGDPESTPGTLRGLPGLQGVSSERRFRRRPGALRQWPLGRNYRKTPVFPGWTRAARGEALTSVTAHLGETPQLRALRAAFDEGGGTPAPAGPPKTVVWGGRGGPEELGALGLGRTKKRWRTA